jgi:hypothetical protein
MENTAWLPDSKEVKESREKSYYRYELSLIVQFPVAPEVHESKTTPDLEPQTQQDTQGSERTETSIRA